MSSPASAPRRSLSDLLAGVTAAAVVLPKAMAYASVAGLPVAVGLYTALVPMLLYALLGSSRVLSVSSTSTLAILTATQLGLVVPDGDPGRLLTVTATLTLLVGAMLMLAAVLRLGFVANFISLPVLVGFKSGIGLVIILDQLPKLFGVHIQKENFFLDLYHLGQALPQSSWLTLVVALVTLVVLVFMEWRFPHSPAPLLGVGIGIALVWGFGLNEAGVAIVGSIPTGLPALTMPDLTLVLQLLPGAAGIALMSFTETIAAGRAFVGKGEPEINPNRELVATGLANLGGAFCGSMPAGGGTSQTAVVRSVGGLSQWASAVTAAMALATMIFLAPLLSWLPSATLAVVVIVYSVGLIQPGEFRKIGQIRMMEFRWAAIACLGVLLFGTLASASVGHFLLMWMSASLGAIGGFWLSWWLGVRYRHRLTQLRWLTAERLARSRLFFQRRGLWAVFFSRFLSPLRATLPLVSGASGLPLWSFQLANVSSGLLWPFLLLSPGALSLSLW